MKSILLFVVVSLVLSACSTPEHHIEALSDIARPTLAKCSLPYPVVQAEPVLIRKVSDVFTGLADYFQTIEPFGPTRTPPRPQYTPPPPSSASIRRVHATDILLVAFIVDQSGKVPDARIIDSSDAALNQMTIDAIKEWRFQPAKVTGLPIMCPMLVTVEFSYQESLTSRHSAMPMIYSFLFFPACHYGMAEL